MMICGYNDDGGTCSKLATYAAVEPKDSTFKTNRTIEETPGGRCTFLCAKHVDIFMQGHPTWSVIDNNPYECVLCGADLEVRDKERILFDDGSTGFRCKDRVFCRANNAEFPQEDDVWCYLSDMYDRRNEGIDDEEFEEE